jgi:formamidopyrimidine-DNA glycosylase
MPELPDVEVLKRYLDSTSLHQKIEDVQVESETVLKEVSPRKLRTELVNQEFESTERHGKFMFVELQNGHWMVLHFGMTGDLKYYKKEEKRPEYGLVEFKFNNGYQLDYIMTRKLGEVRIIEDVSEFVDKRELGPDVMAKDFTFDKFKQILTNRRGMIKSTLMNQNIMAGIGNVYSDEILFQAGIHPKTPVDRLNEDELKEIYKEMYKVLETAIDYQAIPDDFPVSFITKLRGEEEAKCPKCGGEIKRIDVSGRTAYYCSNCQKLKE